MYYAASKLYSGHVQKEILSMQAQVSNHQQRLVLVLHTLHASSCQHLGTDIMVKSHFLENNNKNREEI